MDSIELMNSLKEMTQQDKGRYIFGLLIDSKNLKTCDIYQFFRSRLAEIDTITGVNFQDVKAAFKRLESLGVGVLDRNIFQWNYTRTSVCEVALSKGSRLIPIVSRELGAEKVQVSPSFTTEGLVSYVFPVREALTLQFALPKDLSKREAHRLAAYIKALAID